MSYLGKHRASRPLVLRLPVVGGVAAVAVLIWPVLLVTANVGDGNQPSTRFRNVAGAERVPTSVPKDGASIPATTSIPIDEDDPVSVADGARPSSSTTTAGGWSAASHSGDVFALAANPLSVSSNRTTTSTTHSTTSTTKPAPSTTRPTSKPTTSKPSSTTKPPTSDPTTTTDPPTSDPTTTTPADPTTEPEPSTTTDEPAPETTTPETTEATTDPGTVQP